MHNYNALRNYLIPFSAVFGPILLSLRKQPDPERGRLKLDMDARLIDPEKRFQISRLIEKSEYLLNEV